MPLRLPTVLYLSSDATSQLSDYQCLLRQQIEVFQATIDDVQYCASRHPIKNRSIHEGQVGIRCKHCADLPEWERATGAVYYPGTIDMLYQAGQNLAKNHICGGCTLIPRDIQRLLSRMRSEFRRARLGKKYWSRGARILGIYEDQEMHGLRFRDPATEKKRE